MVPISDLNTGLGRRFCMTALVKTFSPKISPGASVEREDRCGGLVVLDGVDGVEPGFASTH